MPAQGYRGCFQGSGTDGAAIWVKDVGDVSSHGKVPGKIPTWSRKADNRDTSKETGGGGTRITTNVGSDVGGGI